VPTLIKNTLKIEGMDSLISVVKQQDRKLRPVSKTDNICAKAITEKQVDQPLTP